MSTITVEQLSTLSLKELIRLETRLPALIEKAHMEALARANQAFASKLSAVAAEYGLKPSEIAAVPAGGNGKARKVAKVAKRKYTVRKPIVAKYRDPNSDRTWTGRGPTPGWMKASGKPKDFFLVR